MLSGTDSVSNTISEEEDVVIVSKEQTKWDDEAKEKDNLVSLLLQHAQLEWDKFCEDYRHSSVLSEEVVGKYTLGTYDDEGQPCKEPIYEFGPVKKRGKDLPSGFNIADYINKKGIFSLLTFFIDHKRQLESLSNVVIGKLASHSTDEVDCKSLFSKSGALALPNRNRTKIEMFERLILGKHRLARVYCDKEKLKKELLCRWKEKD